MMGVSVPDQHPSQWQIQDFPEVGAPTLRGWVGKEKYYFGKFSQKLYEIKRIWTPGGAPPSRSAKPS